MSRVLLNVGAAALLLGSAGTAYGQAIAAPPAPQIVTQGRSEIEVAPDRAELRLSVETRASTGADAGRQNSQIVSAVLDTLRRGFGLTDRDLVTLGYMLQPQMVYPRDGAAPRVEGYVATNTVRVRTGSIDRVGAMIDASLRKGATNISGLSFSATGTDDARRTALSMAVEQARKDAEAMAVAAGGRLGPLLELINQEMDFRSPAPMMMAMEAKLMSDAAPTQIQAGEQTILARVTARWVFQPGAR
jgi:uncharacterized protein YggE